MKIRKLPWWYKDVRQKRGEKIRAFKISQKRAALANVVEPDLCPFAIDIVRARYYMELATLEAMAAGAPRPAFAFDPNMVAQVHHHKRHEGDGLWFQLKDGRVFNSSGEQDSSDPAAYNTTDD